MAAGNLFTKLESIKVDREKALLFLTLMLYKMILELSYALVLVPKVPDMELHVSVFRFICGVLWVVLCFALCRFEDRRASSFFIMLFLFIGIVPMTVWFSLSGGSALYYHLLLAAYAGAECLIRVMSKPEDHGEPAVLSKVDGLPVLIVAASVALMVATTGFVVLTKGLPTLTALDLTSVYSIRGESYFIQNKYLGYLYKIMMTTLAPFILALTLVKRQYFTAGLTVVMIMMFYLYSGNKTTLMCVPLILLCYVVMRFPNGRYRFYQLFTGGIGASFVLAWLADFYMPCSLFIRRVLILPCQLKFAYYEFFTENPHIGMFGVFPGGVFSNTPYDEAVGKIIGRMYYDSIDMNANTGFMIEGFERFGYVGIFLIILVFAVLLLLADRLQLATNHLFALTAAIYPLYTLNDGQILSPLFTGYLAAFVLICLFYYNDSLRKEEDMVHAIQIYAR